MTDAAVRGAAEARQACQDDLGRISDLYVAARSELTGMRGGRVLAGLNGRPEPVEGSFARQLADGAMVLVAGLLGRDVVGFGTCRTRELHEGDRLGSIEELYVAPDARRSGVGRAMLAYLLGWCRMQRCTGVDASALPGSRAVKSFFEAERFTARLLVMYRSLP